MLALLSSFQPLISALPTKLLDLLDRPKPVAPATEEVIAFSLAPARLALAAIEKFTAPEPDATARPEPCSPEAFPDYWALELPTSPAPETVALSPLPSSTPDLWAIAAKPIPPIHCQPLLPAAREVVVPEKVEPTNAQEKAIALEYETGPLTIMELCYKYQMSAKQMTDLCREHLGCERYGAAITRKRQARLQPTSKPEPTPEPSKLPRAIAPTPQMQPDGETPNLNGFDRVQNATGWFQVRPHGEGHVVDRWKKTKKTGWELTTHLVADRCDCEQSRKKPSSTCCHVKAVKSWERSEKIRLLHEEWERQDETKRAKVKADLDAIAAQRSKDAEAKISELIRTEAQTTSRPTASGLEPKLIYPEQRSHAQREAQILIMECSFNRQTGEEFLSERYGKKALTAMELEELQDLIEHLSIHKQSITQANLKDIPLAKSGLKEGSLCRAKNTGFKYRIKRLSNDGFATLQTLMGNFETFLPIDRLEAL
ncbi:hypothetical protein NG791_26375 [Laspinema sp. D1]|uniref:hypothetical protein n=1 Tax=Laspinema palackyanum TaxID=3231601 RepID=UPI00346BFCB1|nr:hypothetical protein [Laspinema sp. D2b]